MQNEITISVVSDIGSVDNYKKDLSRLAKNRGAELDELVRAEKLSLEQVAELREQINNKSFESEKRAAMQLHKLRMDNAKAEGGGSLKDTLNKDVGLDKDSLVYKGGTAALKTISVASGAVVSVASIGVMNAKGAIDVYAKTEASQARTKALAGADYDQERLDEIVNKVSAETIFSPADLNDAVNNLIQGGKTFEEALKMVETVAQTAIAHGKSVDEASAMLVATTNQFGLTADDTAHVSDVLTKATTVTAASFDSLQEGLKNCGAAMNGIGQSAEATVAQLGVLANSGYGGAESGTALRSMATKVATEAAQKALEEYGVKSVDENGQLRALEDIFAELKAELVKRGENDVEKTQVWQKLAGEFAAQANILADNREAIKANTEQLVNATGANKELAESQSQGIKGLVDQINSTWEVLQNTVGKELSPVFMEMGKGIKEALGNSIENIKENIKKFVDLIAPSLPYIKNACGELTNAFTSFFTGSIMAAILLLEPLSNTVNVIKDLIMKMPGIKDVAREVEIKSTMQGYSKSAESVRDKANNSVKKIVEEATGRKFGTYKYTDDEKKRLKEDPNYVPERYKDKNYITNAEWTERRDELMKALSPEQIKQIAEIEKGKNEALENLAIEYKSKVQDLSSVAEGDDGKYIVGVSKDVSSIAKESDADLKYYQSLAFDPNEIQSKVDSSLNGTIPTMEEFGIGSGNQQVQNQIKENGQKQVDALNELVNETKKNGEKLDTLNTNGTKTATYM